MIVRVKLFWKIFCYFFAVGGFYTTLDKIKLNGFTVDTLLLVLSGIIMFPILVFILPTLTLKFTKYKIILKWKIGIGFFNFYECKREALYNQVNISDWTFYSINFNILYLSGPNNFGTFLGLYLTKKKESFLILANYANYYNVDIDAQRVLNKYKKKYGKKINVKDL
ncbi:MAG: hypothetical protein P8X42_17615, partial [Calditrichaceae bacterium]